MTMKTRTTWIVAAMLGITAAASAQVIDTSETRVQTTLDPGFKRIGTIRPRAVGEIAGQNWSLGCETLDRGFASYDSYKDYLVPLGIRRIRLQGGWATTEREPGKYDWRWLDHIIDDVEVLKALFQQYAPQIKLWQGEAGAQSEFCLGGALCKYPWTELTQAKWQTRRMLGDLGHDVESLVFSIADLDYNRWDGYRLGDIDRYGLVKTDKQYRLLKVKTAYYAVQNVVAIFDDSLVRAPDFPCEIQCPKATACYAYKNKQSGRQVLTFWDTSGVPSDRNDTVPATFTMTKGSFVEPVWVDLITGGVFAIPADRLVREGDRLILKDIPVYDAPSLITDRRLVMP